LFDEALNALMLGKVSWGYPAKEKFLCKAFKDLIRLELLHDALNGLINTTIDYPEAEKFPCKGSKDLIKL
jgi:hypothetical protein